jgi:hypothetical protein
VLKATVLTCAALVGAAPTVSPVSDASEPRVRVFVRTLRGVAGRRGASVVAAALRESSQFRIVNEAREADLVLEPSAVIPDIPPELSELNLPPQPCYVMVSHWSRMILPGSVSTHSSTCSGAGRAVIRGIGAQLRSPDEAVDDSI